MSKVCFIGDLHFGHRGIEKFRPRMADTEHNDDLLTNNILSSCSKRDTLWLLGDCFLTVDSLDILRLMNKHIGYIHMVLGNHDTQDARYKEIILPAIEEGLFKSVHGLYKMRKSKFWLSHAPIHPQELWGKVNVHGHVHFNTIPDDRYVNVSCDNTNLYPVTAQDIHRGWRG